ncbi:hypothetical protein [Nostoc sp. CCY0012]|uniref:hypothetical protein n=1 Tax=Nostoc sp. CCY0012 TaxID=1056123 RepID=UPI0039C68EFF
MRILLIEDEDVLASVLLKSLTTHYVSVTGNQVLQRRSNLFQSAFRSGEVLGYWDHGEFVVGISGLTKVEVNDRLINILTTLCQQIFTASDGDHFQVGCNLSNDREIS